ncbi:HAD-IIA family hydrolase [Cohnella sp. AR92]|uniref:HAD-IIA family hydrolase n=1 Tax=Cohnella sp. AR92 TaxID=648716 RepID=UPI001315731E|nr:HAD-IIA family hydrolase [Cohnella sp. AR92]
MSKQTIPHPPRMTKPRALMFDLDGTLYRGDDPIPGADRLISELEALGVPCWYLTNNSTRTPAQVAEHLHRMGIHAEEARVVTSAAAAAHYAKERFAGRSVYVIGEHGLRHALTESGFRLAAEGEADVGLVVQGIDRSLTFDKLTAAVRYLLGGAKYILTNPDLQLPVADGILPGAGSISAMLQAATSKKPILIGKPSTILTHYALEKAGVAAEEAWVIGDNPLTDIAAGEAAGCKSLLVLTGVCTEDDWRERCEAAGAMPAAVLPGPHELLDYIRSIIQTPN